MATEKQILAVPERRQSNSLQELLGDHYFISKNQASDFDEDFGGKIVGLYFGNFLDFICQLSGFYLLNSVCCGLKFHTVLL